MISRFIQHSSGHVPIRSFPVLLSPLVIDGLGCAAQRIGRKLWKEFPDLLGDEESDVYCKETGQYYVGRSYTILCKD